LSWISGEAHFSDGEEHWEGYREGYLIKILKISEDDLHFSLNNLDRLGCLLYGRGSSWDASTVGGLDFQNKKTTYKASLLGAALVDACEPQLSESNDSD